MRREILNELFTLRGVNSNNADHCLTYADFLNFCRICKVLRDSRLFLFYGSTRWSCFTCTERWSTAQDREYVTSGRFHTALGNFPGTIGIHLPPEEVHGLITNMRLELIVPGRRTER
jgi:hypothetical protein